MSAITIEPNNLLEYNQQYKILICRQCQYAIQKNALQSHLLRHKIYRGKRQQLLSSVSKLDLLEPQDVPVPLPGSIPITTLSILLGFRCLISGCQHLTVSSKRMQRHWTEVHERNGHNACGTPPFRQAKLQTFFRGTKVRYFEVGSLADNGDDTSGSADAFRDSNQNAAMPFQTQGSLETATTATSQHNLLIPTAYIDHPLPTNLNLQALKYFYHFLTGTSLTLPTPKREGFCNTYWRRQAVDQALQRPSLMFGILAISAFHLALLADQKVNKRQHHEQAMQFETFFNNELKREDLLDLASTTSDMQTQYTRTRDLVENIQNILPHAQWASMEHQLDASLANSSGLSTIISFVQGYVAPTSESTSKVDDTHEAHEDGAEESFHATNGVLGTAQSGQSRGNSLRVITDHLHELPFLIAESLGRTEVSESVFATLSAIQSLIEYCKVVFETNAMQMAWKTMASWLIDLPEHFHEMLQQKHPAALVVVAHWAVFLVKRAGTTSSWLLTGSANAIMTYVTSELAIRGPAVLSLVDHLEKTIDT